MASTFAAPVASENRIARFALFMAAGAAIALTLAVLLLLAIGAPTVAPQHGACIIAAIVLATYVGGGALVGAIMAELLPDWAS